MRIPIAKTEFTEEEFRAIHEPLKSGWVVQGPHVRDFEEKWSVFTGAKYSLATTSCTTALHLSLHALGIGPGDEVIVPAFTWIASANVVEQLNARVVFCDIDPQTYNIDVGEMERLVTDKTRAVMPVHLFGLAADMEAVLDVTGDRNLVVVEDAACGFGARYKDRHVGVFGDTGCFSFHPRKAITTGEGGMITVRDKSLYEKLKALRDHGARTSDLARHTGEKPYILSEYHEAGFNYRMTDIQAALGSSQMDRAEGIHSKRLELAREYDRILDDIPWLKKPVVSSGYVHGYQSYVALFAPFEVGIENVEEVGGMRNEFMEFLQERGISTRPGTHAVHALDYYSEKYGLGAEDYPNAYIADRCTVAFPLYNTMGDEEFAYIETALHKYSPRLKNGG